MSTLAGSSALVTGAGRGIGRAIACRLARDGALVAVHYGSSHDAAMGVVDSIERSGGQAFVLQADLRSVDAIAAMFELLDDELQARTGSSKFDILVNNAGVGTGMKRLEETTEADFDLLFDTNFKGLFFVTQQAVPRMRDGGKIVNVSSLSTRGAMAALPAYAASKIPINSFTLSLAQALGPRGIAVNAVLPGMVVTDLTNDLRRNPTAMEAVVKACAFGRAGQPDDIAGAVSALMSPDCSWITGQLIEVTGGSRL
jgi:3-oxoacyl-[acyl-carrier protein] reductase